MDKENIIIASIISIAVLLLFGGCMGYDLKVKKYYTENGYYRDTVKGEDCVQWIKPMECENE